MLRSLLSSGFKGSLYPIHPDGGEISGLDILRGLKDVPGPVDLVISCIPARFVPRLIRECADKRSRLYPCSPPLLGNAAARWGGSWKRRSSDRPGMPA